MKLNLFFILDRKIEFPIPDRRQKRLIFSTITAKMNLSEEVDLEDFVARYVELVIVRLIRNFGDSLIPIFVDSQFFTRFKY